MTQADHRLDVNPAPSSSDELDWMDDAVAPFRAMVDMLAATPEPFIAPRLGHAIDAPREGMYLEQMRLNLPFELDLRVLEDGRVQMAGAPPTQYTRTSILPVFHSMALTVKAKLRDG